MKKEYFYAGVSILFWGSSAAVSSLMLGGLSPLDVVFFGSLSAIVFLFLVNLCTGRLKCLRSLSAKDWFYLGFLGLLGMFSASVCLYWGLSRLKAQQAFIINYLWPILTVFFSCLLLKEKLTIRKSAALLLSFFGVMVVASEGNLGSMSNLDGLGVLVCIAAASSYALFSVLNLRVTCDKFAAMMVYYAATALVSLLVILVGEPSIPRLEPFQWLGSLWIGVLCNGLAYTTWALAMDLGNTAKLSNLAYFTPFVSLIYIYFLLHEPILSSSYIGMLFILAGVLLQAWKAR